MNISDIWDWAFFWSMFRNFMASISSFVMIIIAISAAGLLVGTIVRAVRNRA